MRRAQQPDIHWRYLGYTICLSAHPGCLKIMHFLFVIGDCVSTNTLFLPTVYPVIQFNRSRKLWLLPDARDELSMLISGENLRQDRSQPLHSLLCCILLQHSEELLFYFRFIT